MPRIFAQEVLGKDRVNGFYDTPPKTVSYMVQKILKHWHPGLSILDPAVGDGVFLKELSSRGVDRKYLYGFDIDASKVNNLRQEFPNVQVFDSTNPFPDQYDFVIGNPPYNGDESHFVRENRPRLKRLFPHLDAKNTYSMITVQAVRALRPGGRICVILMDSFLTNSYYKRFRQFLLANTHIEELLLAPWKLFHGRRADVRTCIITMRVPGVTSPLSHEFPLFSRTPNEEDSAQNAFQVRAVDRVLTEDEYWSPRHCEEIPQAEFSRYRNRNS